MRVPPSHKHHFWGHSFQGLLIFTLSKLLSFRSLWQLGDVQGHRAPKLATTHVGEALESCDPGGRGIGSLPLGPMDG